MVLLDGGLDLFEVAFGCVVEGIDFGVDAEVETALEILDGFDGDEFAVRLVVGLELLEGSLVVQLQEVLQHHLRPQLGDLQQLVQEHLQNHHPLSEVLVVVSPELALLGQRRDGDPRVQPLERQSQPLEVRIPAFHCFSQRLSEDVVADVGLFEDTTLSFLEFCDSYLYVFSSVKDAGRCLYARNRAVKGVVIAEQVNIGLSFLWP